MQRSWRECGRREMFAPSINGNLTAELRSLDRRLKSNPSLDGAALRECRQALDNVRLTAWSVSELLNARQSQKNPQAVISFLTAEGLRRLSQMVRDLSGDLEQDALSGRPKRSGSLKFPLRFCVHGWR